MATIEWISVDDVRKPDIAEGEEFSEDVLLLICGEDKYWYELGCWSRGGLFVRHDDPVWCRVRYWSPLLIPAFPPRKQHRKDLAAVEAAFEADAKECRRKAPRG